MPGFITAHVITCMTRQDLKRLIGSFQSEGTDQMKLVRSRADTLSGRLICEWSAPGRDELTRWLESKNIRFRGKEEWIMQVQLAAEDGVLEPPSEG